MRDLDEVRSEELSRSQAADKLIKIAEQIKKGSVSLDDAKVEVPERVNLEIRVEDGEIDLRLRWGDTFGDAFGGIDEDEEEITYGGADDDDDEENDTLYADDDDDL